MVAQRGAGVVGAEHAALLQHRDDLVDERRQPPGGDVRDHDVAVGGVGLDETPGAFPRLQIDKSQIKIMVTPNSTPPIA